MIKNVIFDIGMVLVNFHWEATMKELGIPEDAINTLGQNMIHHKLWHELDLALIPEEQIIENFKKITPECSEYIDLFFNNMDEVVTMFEGADDFIKHLKEKGYNVYLLSNYPARMFELHKKRFHFYPYVDGEVVSFQYNITKPDPKIYELICNKYDLNPQECIFLDDRQENIDAAISYGMQGFVVTDPFEARNKLMDILHIS